MSLILHVALLRKYPYVIIKNKCRCMHIRNVKTFGITYTNSKFNVWTRIVCNFIVGSKVVCMLYKCYTYRQSNRNHKKKCFDSFSFKIINILLSIFNVKLPLAKFYLLRLYADFPAHQWKPVQLPMLVLCNWKHSWTRLQRSCIL